MASNSNNQTPPAEPLPVASNPDFEKTIAESKATIQAAQQKPVRGGSRPGAGRRPKDAAQTQQQSPPPPQSGALPPQAPPNLEKYLVAPLMAISKIPAANHRIPELALTEEEATLCAKSLNECCLAFIPDVNNMSPKTGAIVGLCLTVGSIAFAKYSILAQESAKRAPPPIVDKPVETVDTPANPLAGEYFAKSKV